MSLTFSVNERCTSCMACVRVCPVEAISVSGEEVAIHEETCIECGLCVPACHHEAIDVVGDLPGGAEAIRDEKALLILPTEVTVFFFPATPEQIINACYDLGFDGVFFEAVGDELVAGEYLRIWRDEGPRAWIRSTSPIVVDYCRTRLPELLPFLAPVVTPAVALARHLGEFAAQGYRIVYAGLGTPGSNGSLIGIDDCISLSELEQVMAEVDASPASQPLTLTRIPPERRRHLSLAGGLPRAMLDAQTLSARGFQRRRGLESLGAVARAVIGEESPLGFVDVLPFEGNLGHPAFGPDEDLYWRKTIAELAEPQRAESPVVERSSDLDLGATFRPKHETLPTPDPEEVQRVLAQIGMTPSGRYWNTGSCGHATCLEFAQAVARGRSTLSLCPIYLNRQYERASEDALHDGLTGVFTYRVLEERLAEEVSRANRTGTSIAVLFIDLDKFKDVNDIFGHGVGNLILTGVAKILGEAIRSTDIACRYGGDEFVVILVNPDRPGAAGVAEQIRRRVEDFKVPTPDGEAGVTLSIGLAYHSGAPRSNLTSEVLMAEADASLYVAKAHGGNAVHPAVEGELVR